MKKIMILGAGIYQVPLIKKAKDMGLWTIVVSIQGNYPGFHLADQVFLEDTTHPEKVLEIARAEKIDGIVTTGTDVAIPTLGKVVSEMGLCGVSYEASLKVSDKFKMKDAFLKTGVRTAKYRKAYNISEALAIFHELQKPVIFKAVDSSGSRGIVKVIQENEIEPACREVWGVTKLDYFLIEEFIEGIEFGAQAFVVNSKILFSLAHGDIVFQGKTGVPIGHFAPYYLNDEVYQDMEEQIQKAVSGLQLDYCALNMDFILKDHQVHVLEIGARTGATCLPELVSIYYQFDYYEQIIRVSLGEAPRFQFGEPVPNAGLLMISDRTGRIVRQQNHNLTDERILDISFDYQVGDRVRKFAVGPDRIGQMIVKGSSLDEAMGLLEQVKSRVDIEVAAESNEG